MEKFKNVLKNFDLNGEVQSVVRYGEGHINETYLVKTDKTKYIMQKINDRLFKDVPALMRNIRLVTEFCRTAVEKRGGDPDREALSLVYTLDGEAYYHDESGYYRVYIFIDGATSHQIVTKPEHFFQSAVAFGDFANLLAKFDASQLYEPLPNFHNTTVRFANFQRSVELDTAKRVSCVQKEIEWFRAREGICGKIVSLLSSGAMPLRVTHNDTKLNNVMIDDATDKAVAVIDLDTVMPGSLCYDFGDSIRFGCNPALEDEPDLSKVVFSKELFEVYTKGYLSSMHPSITKLECENLTMGAILMTYECGMRFLADYLDGDTYFRTHRPAQNLDRARTQIKLVEDMESKLDELNAIVAKVCKQYNI